MSTNIPSNVEIKDIGGPMFSFPRLSLKWDAPTEIGYSSYTIEWYSAFFQVIHTITNINQNATEQFITIEMGGQDTVYARIKAIYYPDNAPFSTWVKFAYGNCFVEGSKIETISGYVKIEDLKKGDLVRTYKSGFKAITGILQQEIYYRKENKEENHLYCLKKENFGELIDDLVLTGDHLILVDDASTAKGGKKDVLIKVDGKLGLRCSKDNRSVLLEEWGTKRIYNLSVGKKREGIYANGLLVSSGDEREM